MPSRSTATTTVAKSDLEIFRNAPLQYIRRAYVRFLQGLYWYRPTGSYHWSASSQETEILITDETPLDMEVVGVRPAICVVRGPVGMQSLGFDDMLTYDPATGRKEKALHWTGVMTINVISRNGQEAENLATFTAEHMWLLREEIMKAGFFNVGQQLQIGSPSPPGSIITNDQGKGATLVAVASPYSMPRRGAVTPLGAEVANGIRLFIGGMGELTEEETGLPALSSYPAVDGWYEIPAPSVGVEIEVQSEVPLSDETVGEFPRRSGLPALEVKV